MYVKKGAQRIMAEQMTQAGYDALNEELKKLNKIRNNEIPERIRDAKAYGDLSENAEYESAKEDQGNLEDRIAILQKKIREAEVIRDEDVSDDHVGIGTTVKLKDVIRGEEVIYDIVGDTESDPFEGKLSSESIVGRNLLGRNVGDVVHFSVPAGDAKYEIMSISKTR